MSLLHYVVVFKGPLLRLAYLSSSYILGQPLLIIVFQHRAWIEWTAWRGGRGSLPGSRRPCATRLTCVWLSDSLDYLQGYFTPEILNRIHILRMGRQGQRPDVVLAFPLDYQFSRMTLFKSSFKQNGYWNKAMLIAPRSSAAYRCIWSHG